MHTAYGQEDHTNEHLWMFQLSVDVGIVVGVVDIQQPPHLALWSYCGKHWQAYKDGSFLGFPDTDIALRATGITVAPVVWMSALFNSDFWKFQF